MTASGPNWAEVMQGVGSIVSAAVTIFLAYVAVNFREEVRATRRRPILTLTHDPEVHASLFRDPHWNYEIYLRVENTPGQDRALHVGLELVHVRSLGDTPPLSARTPRRPFVVAELGDYEATEVDLSPELLRSSYI